MQTELDHLEIKSFCPGIITHSVGISGNMSLISLPEEKNYLSINVHEYIRIIIATAFAFVHQKPTV